MDERTNAGGAAGLMDKVRDGATSQLTTQKDRATQSIGSVVQAVRQSTQQLRDNQHETIAQYIDQAAGQLERLSSRLQEKSVNELMRDAQDLARRRPAVFIGSAFAIGLLGARFLKSSSDRRHERGTPGGTRTAYDREPRYGTDLTASPSVTPSFDSGRR
jgi:exonuclease VII large subunit